MNEACNIPADVWCLIISYLPVKDFLNLRETSQFFARNPKVGLIGTSHLRKHGFWSNKKDRFEEKLRTIVERFHTSMNRGGPHSESQKDSKEILSDLIKWRKSMPNDFITSVKSAKENFSLMAYPDLYKLARGYFALHNSNSKPWSQLESQEKWDKAKSLGIYFASYMFAIALGLTWGVYTHAHRGEKFIPLVLITGMLLLLYYRESFSNLGHHFRLPGNKVEEAILEEIVIDKADASHLDKSLGHHNNNDEADAVIRKKKI